MKFKASRKALQDALQVAASVATQRGPGKDVLQSVHMEARDGHLTLRATDYEIGLKVEVGEAQVEKEGTLLLNAGQVAGLVRELTDPEVTFRAEGSTCSVACGRSRFKLTVYDPSTFPELAPLPKVTALELPQRVLQEVLAHVLFAAAEDRTRYAFDGVKVLWEGNRLMAVATDGKRLAHYWVAVEGGAEAKVDALLPARALAQVLKILGDTDETCRLGFEERRFGLGAGAVEFTCQQLEGAFPEFMPILEREMPQRVEVESGELQRALRRAALFAPREARSVALVLQEGNLNVNARAAELGEAETDIAVEYGGPAIELGFNVDYLLEFLKVVPEGRVMMEFADPENASRWSDGERFRYLVMPIVR